MQFKSKLSIKQFIITAKNVMLYLLSLDPGIITGPVVFSDVTVTLHVLLGLLRCLTGTWIMIQHTGRTYGGVATVGHVTCDYQQQVKAVEDLLPACYYCPLLSRYIFLTSCL